MGKVSYQPTSLSTPPPPPLNTSVDCQLAYTVPGNMTCCSVNCPGLTPPTVQLPRGVTCKFFSPVNKQLQLCIPMSCNVICQQLIAMYFYVDLFQCTVMLLLLFLCRPIIVIHYVYHLFHRNVL